MASKSQIAIFLQKNITGSKIQFIEKNFGSVEGYVDRLSTEAAKCKMDLMSAYEELYAECAYFSQERFDAHKN